MVFCDLPSQTAHLLYLKAPAVAPDTLQQHRFSGPRLGVVSDQLRIFHLLASCVRTRQQLGGGKISGLFELKSEARLKISFSPEDILSLGCCCASWR